MTATPRLPAAVGSSREAKTGWRPIETHLGDFPAKCVPAWEGGKTATCGYGRWFEWCQCLGIFGVHTGDELEPCMRGASVPGDTESWCPICQHRRR